MPKRSIIAIPPGATIKEQLNDRCMSQKDFAIRMDMSEKHISKLINGDVQLTPDMARRLEIVLGVPAKFWSNLEAIYREKLIKAEAEKSIESDIEIARQFPYNEMVKNEWVPEVKHLKDRVNTLRQYFSVVELSLLSKHQIFKLTCSEINIKDKSNLALLAWAQEAKNRSNSKDIGTINLKSLQEIIPEIRIMTTNNSKASLIKLEKMLAKCGIALVFLPNLKGMTCEAITFMNGRKVVICIAESFRGTSEFWMKLFHELGHIALGHITRQHGIGEQEEDEASKWAINAMIPIEKLTHFKNSNAVNYANIMSFAKDISIAPSIVAEILQYEPKLAITS